MLLLGENEKKINKSIMFLSVHYHKLKIKQQTSFIYLKKKKTVNYKDQI